MPRDMFDELFGEVSRWDQEEDHEPTPYDDEDWD
jgi:hypothetical protein